MSRVPVSASLASSSAIVCSDHLKPGRLLFIHECIALDKQIIGKSIRTLGRLVQYRGSDCMATLEMGDGRLSVDTQLVRDFHCRVGGMLQVIGEMEWREGRGQESAGSGGELLLVARVHRELHDCDVELLRRVVERKRQFEAATSCEQL